MQQISAVIANAFVRILTRVVITRKSIVDPANKHSHFRHSRVGGNPSLVQRDMSGSVLLRSVSTLCVYAFAQLANRVSNRHSRIPNGNLGSFNVQQSGTC